MVAHPDQAGAALGQCLGRIAADIAEALDDHRGAGNRQLQPLQRPPDEMRDAEAGRLAPAFDAAHADRLAGDDLGHRLALVHGVGVHEPRHDLFVGAEIRRHDVRLRPDEGDHLLHVAARDGLQFARRERAAVDGDAALGAAIGQADQGAFPAHPDRQRRHLAHGQRIREARAALGRPQRQVVLDAKALEDLGRTVVAMHRAGDRERALRVEDPVAVAVGHVEMVGDAVELPAGHVEDRVAEERHRGHGWGAPWFGRIGRFRPSRLEYTPRLQPQRGDRALRGGSWPRQGRRWAETTRRSAMGMVGDTGIEPVTPPV